MTGKQNTMKAILTINFVSGVNIAKIMYTMMHMQAISAINTMQVTYMYVHTVMTAIGTM